MPEVIIHDDESFERRKRKMSATRRKTRRPRSF